MAKLNFVLPISTIYNELPNKFIRKFNTVEQKSFDKYVPLKIDTIFHSNLSLTDNNFYNILNEKNAFDLIKKFNIRRFSFDIGPRFCQTNSIDNKYFGIGNSLSIKEIYEICDRKINQLFRDLPNGCKIGIENLNYYNTGAYEGVCEPAFYNEICNKFDIELVLDIPHAQVTAYNKSLDISKHLHEFVFRRIHEIHISKAKIIDSFNAIDYHGLPDKLEFTLAQEIIDMNNNDIDVVIEYYGNPSKLIKAYQTAEKFLNEKISHYSPT